MINTVHQMAFFPVQQQLNIVHEQVKKTTTPTKPLVKCFFLPIVERLFWTLNEWLSLNAFFGPSINKIFTIPFIKQHIFSVHQQQHSIVHEQVKKTTPLTKPLVEWVFYLLLNAFF